MKNKRNTIALSIIAFITAVAVAVIFLVGFGDLSKGDDLTDDKEVTEKQDTDVDKDNDDNSDNHNNDEDDFYADGIYVWYNHAVASTQEMYGELQNGDSFYTPATEHLCFDDDRSIPYYDNLLLVFTYSDLSDNEMDDIADIVEGEVVGVVNGGVHSFQLVVDEHNLAGLEELADDLMMHDDVMYACVDVPFMIMCNDNPWGDEEYIGNEDEPSGNDWWAEAIDAYTAWEYSDYCKDISVGVVDNGVDDEHEDLKGQITFIGDNSVDNITDHGTHVTGVMGALDNDVGLRGIADHAKFYCADLWPYVGENTSFKTMGELMAIFNNMAQEGVRVINNSWGLYYFDEDYYMNLPEGNELDYEEWCERRINGDLDFTANSMIVMIAQLIESGYEDMIFVQAAGNGYMSVVEEAPVNALTSGFFATVTEEIYNNMDDSLLVYLEEKGITYKTIDERIFVVAATTYEYSDDGDVEYSLTTFSSRGESVDICAPGDMVYSTANCGKDIYASWSGTSMAAPIVTGSIAYVWSLDPSLSVSEVRDIILSSAETEVDCEFEGEVYSYPMVNVGSATKMVME